MTKKNIYLALAVLAFLFAYFTSNDFSMSGYVVGGWFIFCYSRKLEGERNWKAIQGALDDYEELISGYRWIGKEAEILASDRVDERNKPGPVEFEHICRTKNGTWFVFYVAVTRGRVVGRSLRPCNERQARARLENHPEVYVRVFGQPEAA